MSEMGPLTFGRPEQEIFLGRDFGRTQDYSESTANQIDAEVKRIVTTAYDRAQRIIEDNQKAMHRIARTLLEKEVLDGDEVLQIIAEESGMDVCKLRQTGPPKPPHLHALPPEDAAARAAARRLLDRVPADGLGWKQQPRSRSLGELATHVTEL